MSVNPRQAPILVTGTGRSGTSLMRAMLNAHPHVHLLQEASFHTWVTRFRRRLTPKQRVARYLRSFSFAWLRLDPDVVLASVPDDLDERGLADVYARLCAGVAARHGKPRWGEKNPLLAPHLGRLLDDFPDARVIYMVRDPRACVASQIHMPWSSASPWVSARLVSVQLDRVWPFRDRVLFVRLEDLLAAPRDTMARVLEFVGEPWDDRVLEHAAHVPHDDGIPFPWLTPAERHRAGASRAWRDVLSAAWIREIESVNDRTMREFAYERAVFDPEPSWGTRFLARLGDVPEGVAFLARALGIVLRYRRAPWPEADEAQRLVCSLNPKAWAAHPDWTLPEPPEPGPGA